MLFYSLPVYDSLLHESQKAITYLFEDFDSLRLLNRSFLSYKSVKIAIAQFLYDVVVVGALHNLINCHNILGLHLLEDFDLFEKSSFEILIGVN